MAPLLSADGIVAGYGDVPILHGVSAYLDEAELVAVIGPNGAGKSTLIKAIFGLLQVTEGTVVFDGQDITHRPPERVVSLGISYVPQVSNTFPGLTVRENLEMGAYMLNYGIPGHVSAASAAISDGLRRILHLPPAKRWYRRLVKKDYVQSRVEAVLDLFPDLRPLLKLRTGKLSGGQQQMVALARALILEPKVLLIDEPSAGLAPKLVDAVFHRIEGIHSAGTAILLVEQNARKALEMADRGYVLEMGRNRYAGVAKDLLGNPEVGKLYLGGAEKKKGERLPGSSSTVPPG